MSLPIKPAAACAVDQLSLGEIMIRLDPGEGRIRTTRHFTAWEGALSVGDHTRGIAWLQGTPAQNSA